MKRLTGIAILCFLVSIYTVSAQENNSITEEKVETVVQDKSRKLQIGGYGEITFQRMFYSDNIARYSTPESHKNASHGRFDLPHAVIYLSYDFGRGWKFSTEIEFEHGGTGTTYEIENSETGEYETEIEKGGEVALEQFWIEKTWSKQANLRIGHIIVPIGITNQYHMPTEFFTVMRPEEESTILPCTWHETGMSFWGRYKEWRYELQFIAGLDAERFSNANWIQGGSTSPYEFKIANAYAGAFRLDNFSVKGLRIGLSGYYGHSAINSLKAERYKNQNINGAVMIGALDATYNDHNILARANFIYGHLNDSYTISTLNKKLPSASPSPRTDVASDVMSWYIEAGYDIMPLIKKQKKSEEKLYVFAHYGFCDSMYKTDTSNKISPKGWTERRFFNAGINYFPIKEIVIKGEYSMRKFKAPYNNEPTISLAIAYSGFFTK